MKQFGVYEKVAGEVYSSMGGGGMRLDITGGAENVLGLKKNGIEVVVPDREPGYIGEMRLERGHVMWEFDVVSRKLEKAVYADVELEVMGSGRIVRKLVEREGCMYFGALNRGSALKKLVRMNDEFVRMGQRDQR